MKHGTLLSHIDTDLVTRAQLLTVPAPEPTATFRPVPHYELIDMLDRVLAHSSIHIRDERFALRRDGAVLFGVLELAYGESGDGFAALGLRTGNNRTMSLQICAGRKIFVCDNLVFRGDLIALRRKHTAGLNLREELTLAVVRFQEHFGHLTREIEQLKQQTLADVEAKALIHDGFARGLMPLRFLPRVSTGYFEPTQVCFAPRTAWSLHNAFTGAAKDMPLTTRLPAIQGIGKLFGMSSGPQKAPLLRPAIQAIGKFFGLPSEPQRGPLLLPAPPSDPEPDPA